MKRTLLAVAAIMLGTAAAAHAFCGFYVAGGKADMFNDATQVVLMRKGTRTVLSMQNNYKGPPENFAMVIPVPTVLQKDNVKTLPKEVFERVELMGAPRLVEYWEQDPCYVEPPMDDKVMMASSAEPMAEGASGGAGSRGVKIEAQFTVGEYEIVILSAKDSTGLDAWLREQKYNIPAGAEPLLRPYVEGGMKFFVAKVDVSKVTFKDGRAELSPLRVHYDSEQFNLPIRLGLANSSGKQDLIVNILAPNQRYEVANYKNVTIPTNITVKKSVKDKFGAFYTALFDATVEKNPGAVVTEYAWQATSCDPCPGPQLDPGELMTLGMDVLPSDDTADDDMGGGGRGWQMGSSMVLTRLHARYGKDITNDLEFKTAEPIVGGREFVIDDKTGKLEEGAQKSSMNNFQGRYAIRHAWEGQITCANPVRGRWGGPPNGNQEPTKPALDLAFAPRGSVQIATEVKQDIPELGIKFVDAAALTPHGTLPTGDDAKRPAKKKSGCGCGATDAGGGLVFAIALALGRRRRKAA